LQKLKFGKSGPKLEKTVEPKRQKREKEAKLGKKLSSFFLKRAEQVVWNRPKWFCKRSEFRVLGFLGWLSDEMVERINNL